MFLLLASLGLMQSASATNQPSMESDGVVLAITEATIIHGQTVTMMAGDSYVTVHQTWWKGTTKVGEGPSLTIKDFEQSKAGTYTVVQQKVNGEKVSTNYQLNYLTLGEDIDACQAQMVDFDVPDGPVYDWSTGAMSNNFRITFQESAVIAVSAKTEFGHVVKDEKIISISPEVYELEESQTSEVIESQEQNNYSFQGRA